MTHPGAALRAVLFDLDGTLVDTAGDFIPAVQTLRAEHGLAPLEARLIRSQVSNGARALVGLALDMGDDAPALEPKRRRLLELYAAVLGRHARLYPGMRELIAACERRRIAWGIVTNKPRAYTESLLATLALEPGSTGCPDDVAQPKPHPEGLERACTQLGCAAAQAIYVGDHARDIEAGRRAGMYTIAAAYGYLEAGDTARRWGANAIARSSTAVAGLLFPPGVQAAKPRRPAKT